MSHIVKCKCAMQYVSMESMCPPPPHSCPSIKRCFQKSMDTQFIIIVEKDTMVYIIYPKCDDAVVHQIAERYYGIHNIPKSQLCYIITKFPNILPRYLKENSWKPAAITKILPIFYLFVFLFFLSLLVVIWFLYEKTP